jgi:hypothetical protein
MEFRKIDPWAARLSIRDSLCAIRFAVVVGDSGGSPGATITTDLTGLGPWGGFYESSVWS